MTPPLFVAICFMAFCIGVPLFGVVWNWRHRLEDGRLPEVRVEYSAKLNRFRVSQGQAVLGEFRTATEAQALALVAANKREKEEIRRNPEWQLVEVALPVLTVDDIDSLSTTEPLKATRGVQR